MGHYSPEKDQHHGEENREDIGGREFGQVISPTQAEEASGNKGLANEKDQNQGKKKDAA